MCTHSIDDLYHMHHYIMQLLGQVFHILLLLYTLVVYSLKLLFTFSVSAWLTAKGLHQSKVGQTKFTVYCHKDFNLAGGQAVIIQSSN